MSITLHIFAAKVSEYREVLRENVHLPSVDRAAPGHDAVAEVGFLAEPEVVAAVRDEHVEFLERALVEQHFDALPGGFLAFLMLRVDAFLSAAQLGLLADLHQFLDLVLNVAHIEILVCF